MIVVIGSPISRSGDPDGLGGSAAGIAGAAAAAGSIVQLVGKAGEDPAGDAVMLALAAAGIGHVALVRDAVNATPVQAAPPAADEGDPLATEPGPPGLGPPPGLPLEPADVELALRYLGEFRVIVVAEPQSAGVLTVVADAASYSTAELIVVAGRAGLGEGITLPAGATVLQQPADGDPEGAFAGFVGALAAAVDGGASSTDAFRDLERRLGVSAASD